MMYVTLACDFDANWNLFYPNLLVALSFGKMINIHFASKNVKTGPEVRPSCG